MGRAYFACQAIAGLLWWLAVFRWDAVRHATLGDLPLELAYLDVPLFVLGSGLAAVGLRLAAWVMLAWTAIVTAGMFVYATAERTAGWGLILMAIALGGTLAATAWTQLGHVPTEWLVRGPFAFRPTSDARGHLGRTLRQLVVFWISFLGAAPFGIALLERRWRLDLEFPLPLRLLGFGAFLLASGLGVWSAATMARRGEGTPLPSAMPKRLVIAGPYRFVRNPMAVAGIGQGVAVGLMMGSWLVVAYALLGSALWNWAVRPHEEADLAARFGDEFEAYRKRGSLLDYRFSTETRLRAVDEKPSGALSYDERNRSQNCGNSI